MAVNAFLINNAHASPVPLAAKTAAPAPAVSKASTVAAEPLTRSGFERYYSLEYDKAIRDFEKVQQLHPDDPFATNHLLNAVLFRELYRTGALDTSLYSNNSFLTKKQFPIDPKARAEIRRLTEHALEQAERRLRRDPNDVEALYCRGVTRGLRSTYLGLVEKAWIAALRSAVGARNDHERVLALSPGYTDAKTIVGVHNYIAGSLSWTMKVAASLVGLGGSKSKGIQYLYEAANAGGESSVDATVALALFLRREQRYDESLKLLRRLVADHPRNFLFAAEEGNLLNAAGRGREAIATLRAVIDAAAKGRFHDPHLEAPYWSLGEALRGQREYAAAAEAYTTVIGYPRAGLELKQRAYVAAGEMYDALQQRELATRNYQAAIAADGASRHAQLARQHLKLPYRAP